MGQRWPLGHLHHCPGETFPTEMMGHRHSTERPNLARHVSRSGGPAIVSLSVILYLVDPLLILLLLFTQESDQNYRSVMFLLHH